MKLLLITLLSTMAIRSATAQQGKWNYPNLDTIEVEEVIYGKIVKDIFRGLEQDTSLLTSWTTNQNELSMQALQDIPAYKSFYDEIKKLKNSVEVKAGVPVVNEEFVYVSQNLTKNGVEQIKLYRSSTDEGEIIFSTDEMNKRDSTFYTIYSYAPSPDNKYVVLQMFAGGSDWMQLYVLDVESKQLTEDRIDKTMSFFPNWLPNSKEFFYTQLNQSDNPKEFFNDIKVKHHTIGQPQSQDRLLLKRDSVSLLEYQPYDFPSFSVLPDGKTVRCMIARGVSPYPSVYIAPLDEVMESIVDSQWRRVFGFEDEVSGVAADTRNIYTLSSKSNSDGAIYQISIEDTKNRKQIFAAERGYIDDFKTTANGLYVEQIENGLSHVLHIDEGGNAKEISLPFQGNVDLTAKSAPIYSDETGLYFGLASWNYGFGIYYYDPDTEEISRTNMRPSGPYDFPKDLVVEEVTVRSHDGQEVPLSIIHNKDISKDGNNPTILEAYGAYGNSLEPYLSVETLAWFKRGGILAKAHVRGGGEKGTAWHEAGRRSNKPNSWKDFIACAEYLINEQYTSSEKLAAYGGSAAGITIGKAMTEQPELFQAVVLDYALLNPTRLDQSSNGKAQAEEFGTPSDSSDFQALFEMDPYLSVKKNQDYPAVLLTTGKTDSRIPLWEPAKMAAILAKYRSDNQPSLLRVYEGGHGMSDTEEEASALADRFAFLLWQLDLSDTHVNNN